MTGGGRGQPRIGAGRTVLRVLAAVGVYELCCWLLSALLAVAFLAVWTLIRQGPGTLLAGIARVARGQVQPRPDALGVSVAFLSLGGLAAIVAISASYSGRLRSLLGLSAVCGAASAACIAVVGTTLLVLKLFVLAVAGCMAACPLACTAVSRFWPKARGRA